MIRPSGPETSTACHTRRASPLNQVVLTRRVLTFHGTREDIVHQSLRRDNVSLTTPSGQGIRALAGSEGGPQQSKGERGHADTEGVDPQLLAQGGIGFGGQPSIALVPT